MLLNLWKDIAKLEQLVLGINRRNQDFIRKLNNPKAKELVDNKLLTKRILTANKIPVAQVISVLSTHRSLERFDIQKLPKSFVIKPVHGVRGLGILIFYGKKKKLDAWISADGKTYTWDDIKNHVSRILTGQYSLGGRRKDAAFIEERIAMHPVFKPYVYKGIPDIRVIVYKNIPVMAMTRLPTKESKGTANLHAGAISVGIDMRLGITTTAIQRKGLGFLGDIYDIVEHIPGKPYLKLSGIKIPYWKKVLKLASGAAKAVGLGYCGVDIVIDKEKGPLVLEVNARPGLGIQMANQEGLLERISQVKRKKVKTPERAVEIAMTLFGGEVEEEVEAILGRQIIGLIEDITISPMPEVVAYIRRQKRQDRQAKKSTKKLRVPGPVTVKAKIDTGARVSSIDVNLLKQLGIDLTEEFASLFSKNCVTREQAKELLKELYKKYIVYDAQGQVIPTPPYFLKGFLVVRNANGIGVRPLVRLPVTIGEDSKQITFTVADRKNMNYPVLLGRKDLKDYLIDPTRKRALS